MAKFQSIAFYLPLMEKSSPPLYFAYKWYSSHFQLMNYFSIVKWDKTQLFCTVEGNDGQVWLERHLSKTKDNWWQCLERVNALKPLL